MQIYYGQTQRREDLWHDFKSFIEHTVKCLSAQLLRGPSSRGRVTDREHPDKEYERRIQMEWYRAAIMYLPSSVLIAPDVGRVGGAFCAAGLGL